MMPTRWALACVATVCVCIPLAVASCGTTGGTGSGLDGGSGDSTTQDSGGGAQDTGALETGHPDGSTGDATNGDLADGDGSGQAADAPACVPGCPASVTCGIWTNCTGATITCGEPCTSGKVCLLTRDSPPFQSCQTTPSCVGKCGIISQDVCGVGINCGGCTGGDSCVNNACVPPTGSDGGGCQAPVCLPGGGPHLCGTVANACGATISCACPAGEECANGVCGPPPPECNLGDAGSDGGTKCGAVENACGSGTIACGGCTGDTKCESNVCTACAPPSCGTATCGAVNNGCGPSISCGPSCGADVCFEGACCAPSTCSGVVGCGRVSLGCGVTKSCNPCAAGDVCDQDSGTCSTCTPKTCADYDNAGCNHPDSCGNTLNCCPASTTCTSGICCPAGQVNDEGTCCQPSCSDGVSSGPQVSCGVTIFCGD